MAAGLTDAVQCGAEPRKLLQGVAAGGELLCKKAPVAQRELEMRMREIPVEKVDCLLYTSAIRVVGVEPSDSAVLSGKPARCV